MFINWGLTHLNMLDLLLVVVPKLVQYGIHELVDLADGLYILSG